MEALGQQQKVDIRHPHVVFAINILEIFFRDLPILGLSFLQTPLATSFHPIRKVFPINKKYFQKIYSNYFSIKR